MQIRELFEGPAFSFRGHGFSGYGRGDFTRSHYWAFIDALDDVPAGPAKTSLIDWFCKILRQDRSGFKPDQFRRAAEEGRSSRVAEKAKFQQRHFYYLAHCISEVQSEQMRKFLATWLADFFDRQPGYFQRKRWFDYCGISDPDSSETDNTTGRRPTA